MAGKSKTSKNNSYITKKEAEKNLILKENLIYGSNFNSIFKNGIRDYYTYGFKSDDDLTGSSATIRQNWTKVANVLGDEWIINDKKIKYITYNNFFNDCKNPLNQFYLYSYFSKPTINNLYSIFQLTPELKITQKLSTVVSEKDKGIVKKIESINKNEIYTMSDLIDFNWIQNLNKFKKNKIYTTQQLKYFIQSEEKKANENKKQQDSRNKTVINNLSELNELGIIEKYNKYDPVIEEWFKALLQEMEMEDYFENNVYDFPQNYWRLSTNTMKNFYDNFQENEGFRDKFLYMIQFFSQYFIMGEIGELLIKRNMNKNISEAPFRYRQNYLTESLLDYNLYDLLVAIENKYWCYLKCKHGVACKTEEYIILPLQIRISTMNGREHVMYYDFENHIFSSMRLDFIDEITLYKYIEYDDSNISPVSCEYLETCKTSDSCKKKMEKIKQEIVNSKELLKYVWGVDTSEISVEDNIDKIPKKSVSVEIEYSSKEEEYIKDRFYRECRDFKITEKKSGNMINLKLNCEVLSSKEMYPWVRSYYTRLKSFKENNNEIFVEDDITKIHEIYKNDNFPKNNITRNTLLNNKKNKISINKEIGKISENKGHGALYHSIFSLYTSILADSIIKCGINMARRQKINVRDEVEGKIHEYFPANNKNITQLKNQLIRDINDNEFISRIDGNDYVKFIDKYEENKTGYEYKRYLYHILPLTNVECRWLKSICNHPFAQLFLEKNILNKITNYLGENIKELPISKIKYYDRFHQQYYNKLEKYNLNTNELSQEDKEAAEKYINYFKIVLRNITTKTPNELTITYNTIKNRPVTKKVYPCWIVFCKRNHIFQLYSVNSENDQLEIINFERIANIEENIKSSNKYKHKQLEKKILSCLNIERVITIEFYNHKNVPDRILTEFSPWKKECIYDKTTEKYTMTLYYYKREETELLVRLLSYGPYIKISKVGNSLMSKNLRERINNQYNLYIKDSER